MEDSTWLTRLRHYLLTADERAVFRANPRALAAQLGLAGRETMNGQLDFFGPTVNIAFRVARLSHGGDILVTDTALDAAARRELETLGPAEIFHTARRYFEDDCLIHRLNSLDKQASA
jgi:class 3 adenylate cyclase